MILNYILFNSYKTKEMDIVLQNYELKTFEKLKLIRESKIEQFLDEIINDNLVLSNNMNIVKREDNKIICIFNIFSIIEIGIKCPYKIIKIELKNYDKIIKTIIPNLINRKYYKNDLYYEDDIYDLNKLLSHRIPVTEYILYFENDINIENIMEIEMIHCVATNNYDWKIFFNLFYDN